MALGHKKAAWTEAEMLATAILHHSSVQAIWVNCSALQVPTVQGPAVLYIDALATHVQIRCRLTMIKLH